MQIVEFYRQAAARLTKLAGESSDPAIKAELLNTAARFLRLADFRAKHIVSAA